jgi:DedD protein
VLLGVVGFPLLFDTQPRSVPVDISIDIPAKNAVKPEGTSLPTSPVASAVVASVAQPPEGVAAASAPAAVSGPAPAAPALAAKKEAESKPAPASAPPAADDSERAKALLEGKTLPPQASSTSELRLVLQVGAYADAAKAREARLKLEKAGLKTYTQVVGTKDAQRTRVRVGPFTTRADADKAADKIKALDLPVTVLTL